MEDSNYIKLVRSITKRFEAEADSTSGLIVINEADYKVLFVNTALLIFINKQWSDLILESVASILKVEEYEKLVYSQHKSKSFSVDKMLGKKQTWVSCNIELVSKNERLSLTMESIAYCLNGTTYNLLYGISNPITAAPKCTTSTPLDPWINSFTKLLYVVTDDYKRFWMFILGVIVSISIAQVSVFVSKPSFICKDSSSILKLKPSTETVKSNK